MATVKMKLPERLDFRTICLGITCTAGLLSALAPQQSLLIAIPVLLLFAFGQYLLKQPIIRTPANVALGLLAAVALFSALAGVRPAHSLPIAMQMVIGVALVLSMAGWLDRPERARQAMNGLALVSLLLVAVAPFAVDWITDKFGSIAGTMYEWFAPFSWRIIHPNIMAGAAAMLFVTLLTFVVFSWVRLAAVERVLSIAAVGMLGGLLVVSQSRGALLGAAFGTGAMLLLLLQRRRRAWLPLAAVILFGMLGAGLIVTVSSLSESVAAVRNAPGRVEIWSHAVAIIHDFPFTGIGFGNFTVVTDLFYPFAVAGGGQTHAHNLYLQITVDTGWPGLIAWLASLLVVLLSCAQALRVLKSPADALWVGVSAGVLCGQLAMLTHGLIDAPLWTTRPALLVWIMWGMALALSPPTWQRATPNQETGAQGMSARSQPASASCP